MSVPRYAALAARLLGRAEPREVAPAARDRGLSTIDRALAGPRHRRRALGLGAALAACVAVGVVALGDFNASSSHQGAPVSVVASPLGGGAFLFDGSGENSLGLHDELPMGGRIMTVADGGAGLVLSTGTRLELGGESILALRSRGSLQRFALPRGVLQARVAKLGPDQRFVVETPDAQVEVRGTAFRLEVLPSGDACGDGARTRVDVQSGVVEVRSGGLVARVAAGQHWPSDCSLGPRPATSTAAAEQAAAQQAAAPSPTPSELRASAEAIAPARATANRPGASKRPARNRLAVDNDLFSAALRAQKRGDTSGALRTYADLLQRHPLSPLAESALVERMRLLSGHNAAQTRREAARYLERYPDGFAREEARRFLEGP